MTFLEKRLSTKITQGASVTVSVPGRSKTYLPNGSLFQNFSTSMSLLKMDLSHGVRSRDDLMTVLDIFYIVMLTPYEGFRVKNPQDFQATITNTAVAAIAGTTYQLQRKHTFGGVNIFRNIYKPVSGTVVVYDSGGAPIAGASVDTTTGIVTSASTTPVTWSGEFDIPMTFTDDEWTAQIEIAGDSQGWLTSGDIKLEEIRLS